MKRHSDTSIIPKIIVILGTLSILGIILLFLRERPLPPTKVKRPETPEKLFAQVIQAAQPKILRLWEEGDKFVPKDGVTCSEEILHDNTIGRSYYQCNPHFWQCYWSGGAKKSPAIEIELFGQTFHVEARPRFSPVREFSSSPRFYEAVRPDSPGLGIRYAYMFDMTVREIRGSSQPMIVTDTCRDTYLPQRIYGYGKVKDQREDGFLWDNFDRHLFLDRFYVTNRQVNEWRILRGDFAKLVLDRSLWPKPAYLSIKEQDDYCAFYGKRVLEAKLFDAATMSPADLKNPEARKVYRPQTPWQRDLSKSFLGMSRINPDYQLTPLDCQLAQVEGCPERHFSTDSATWMGFNHGLGFHSERLQNFIDPKLNLKESSRFHSPASPVHELGIRSSWNGEQRDNFRVAFRCYEEVER